MSKKSKPRVSETQVKQIQSLLRRNVTKSEIARQMKKSRPWLDNVIDWFGTEAVSEKSKLVTPKYVEQFEKSEAVPRFREAYKPPKVVASTLEDYVYIGRETWRFLGQKDPSTWTEDDFLKAKENPALKDKETGVIQFNNMIALRAWIAFLGFYDLLKKGRKDFETKGLKRAKGRRKGDYIKSEDEMIRIIQCIERPDTLLFIRTGIESGGRHSSTSLIQPENIDHTQGLIYMREPKTKELIERIISKECLASLRQFIVDFDIQPKEKLFKRSTSQYNVEMKAAGNKAQLGINFTTHALKHTFVSLASAHGVSLEIVSDQTGTDASTLRDFYLAINPAKKRHELLGEPYNVKVWGDLIRDLDPYYRQRYNEIKGNYLKTNGLRKITTQAPKSVPKIEKPKAKRPLPWNAIKGIIASPKTKSNIREAWKKALAIHNQGFSDAEVRQRMGWK